MKSKLKVLNAILLICPLFVFAHLSNDRWDHEKSKTISRKFDVNPNALLKVKNKYGNVDVVSWNQNSIEIDVKITVSGNNESKVISYLDKIDVDFESSKSEVSAQTMIDNSTRGWLKSNNQINYQIDYKIKMPITNNVQLYNDYGTISLFELNGKADINCDYGKILIGSLFHTDNRIDINYTTDSEIDLMNGGSINADYSKISVAKAKHITLNADYSQAVFEHIEDLEFNCDYGKIEVGNGNNISGYGDYLTMRFGNVYKKLEVNADYGGIKVGQLMNGFEQISIKSNYTGIKMGIENGSSFNFTAKLSYGGFDLDLEEVNYIKKIEKTSSKYFEGYVKSENTGGLIEISSDYGGVKLYKN